MSVDAAANPSITAPAWKLDWLTPAWCRLILALALVAGFISQVWYLTHDCPIDLSGDEAQYWDWSRRLDLSYYSKGPLVALLIRASCAIFGDTMPAVRFPSLVLCMMTALVTYALTAKLFRSERLALGVVLLNPLVPMFVAGSMFMTIDPPYYFCWAAATALAAKAMLDGKNWLWIPAGVFVGIGFLAKYAILLWFVGILIFALLDAPNRKRIGWIARPFAVALLFTIPVIVWNARHGWVSLHHVATQTGAAAPGGFRGNPLEFVGSQVGLVGPTMFVLMVGGIVYAFRAREDAHRREMLFLAIVGLSFWGITLIDSFFAKVQANWPAPAYFTLMILTGYFVATRMRSIETWRPWRGWFWMTVAIGLIFLPISRDSAILMPAIERVASSVNRSAQVKLLDPSNLDLMERLRGWKALGQRIGAQLTPLGDGAFILCDDYQQTAETAFYTPGQPKTYCAGPYFGKRLSQYDMWPDRRLHDNPLLLGRNAIYVGKGGQLPKEVARAFVGTTKLPDIPVFAGGVEVKTFKLWRCHGFKGMAPLTKTGY